MTGSVKIHQTTHRMPQSMGGTFHTWTVIWNGGNQKFTSERSAIAFKIEKEHGITT
jgi:hypothetical protein